MSKFIMVSDEEFERITKLIEIGEAVQYLADRHILHGFYSVQGILDYVKEDIVENKNEEYDFDDYMNKLRGGNPCT